MQTAAALRRCNFALTAFFGFVDMLRLSVDDGDGSKPLRCWWSVIGDSLALVRTNCGVEITLRKKITDSETLDYVVVVRLLQSSSHASNETQRFICDAVQADATLVGICKDVFALM